MSLDIDTAHAIVRRLEMHGAYDVKVYEDYSGRGMFGKTCVGFVFDDDSDIALLGAAFADLGLDPADVPRRSDSLGKGVIVY